MKIIIHNQTKKVFYLLEDDHPIQITQHGSFIGSDKVFDIKSDTHSVIENVEKPLLWVGSGKLKYTNSGWELSDQSDTETQELLDSEKAREIRAKRDKLLEETDWIVVKAKETSTNISSSWKTYRQALRDITDHANFPYLNDSDFPTKPQ